MKQISGEDFVSKIMDLPVNTYIDCIAENYEDEPVYVFGKKKLFGAERIVYISPQSGDIAVIQDVLTNTIEDYLASIWRELYENYVNFNLGKPFEMKDWD